MLAGDVVLVGWPDGEGNSTNLPEQMLAILTRSEAFRIEVQWRPGDAWEPLEAPMPCRDYFDALTWTLILVEKAHPFQAKVVSTVLPFDPPDPRRPDGVNQPRRRRAQCENREFSGSRRRLFSF